MRTCGHDTTAPGCPTCQLYDIAGRVRAARRGALPVAVPTPAPARAPKTGPGYDPCRHMGRRLRDAAGRVLTRLCVLG